MIADIKSIKFSCYYVGETKSNCNLDQSPRKAEKFPLLTVVNVKGSNAWVKSEIEIAVSPSEAHRANGKIMKWSVGS